MPQINLTKKILSILCLLTLAIFEPIVMKANAWADTISLEYPVNSIAIFPGVPVELRWSFTGNPVANFYLYKGGIVYSFLGSQTGYPNSVSTFLTKIPLDLPYGTDYQIVAEADQEEQVVSASPFISCEPYVISVPSVTFKRNKTGTAIYVNWSEPNQFKANLYAYSGNYVEILHNGIVLYVIHANILEYMNGSYSSSWWLNKSIIPSGSGYTARVVSSYNSNFYGMSPVFSIK